MKTPEKNSMAKGLIFNKFQSASSKGFTLWFVNCSLAE